MKRISKSIFFIIAIIISFSAIAQEVQSVKNEIKVFYNGLSYCVILPAKAISEVTVKNETQLAKAPSQLASQYIKKFRSTKAGGSFEVKGFVPAIGDDISIVLRNSKGEFVAEYYYTYLPIKSFSAAGAKLISANGAIVVVGEKVAEIKVYDLQGRQVSPDAISTSGLYIVNAVVDGLPVQDKIFVDAR